MMIKRAWRKFASATRAGQKPESETRRQHETGDWRREIRQFEASAKPWT